MLKQRFGVVIFVILSFTCSSVAATQATSVPLRVDFIGATYLPGVKAIAVAGLKGLVGILTLDDDSAKLRQISGVPDEDYTAVARLSDNEALVGSAKGRIYLFDGTNFKELAALSEYDEPIMSIVCLNRQCWVVGARGLVAKSKDGLEWETIEISDVKQPPIAVPPHELESGETIDWYFVGEANIDTETVSVQASVQGAPAVPDKHYVLFPDEGFLQMISAFDQDPPAQISFKFTPGPPFRAGDVSWNVVLFDGKRITIAGEFGLILQSDDDGQTWTRRNGSMTPVEPEPPYWLAGAQDGDTVMLTGAAGVSTASKDGGVTWYENPRLGREGIFGIALLPSGQPLIAGAVGLIGVLQGDQWGLADRTQLKLLSWLKTPVELPDGSHLMLGGRTTAIKYKDGEWIRVPVTRE